MQSSNGSMLRPPLTICSSLASSFPVSLSVSPSQPCMSASQLLNQPDLNAKTLTASRSHHAFQNHSKELWQLGLQLDHLGIVLVMWSSMVPSNYFGFYCSPRLLYFYNSIVIASLSLSPNPASSLLISSILLRQQRPHSAVQSRR